MGVGHIGGCREQASWHCNKTHEIFRRGTEGLEKGGIKVIWRGKRMGKQRDKEIKGTSHM